MFDVGVATASYSYLERVSRIGARRIAFVEESRSKVRYANMVIHVGNTVI